MGAAGDPREEPPGTTSANAAVGDERRRLALALLLAACIGASMTWLETVATALLLARCGAEAYATATALGAVTVPLGGLLYAAIRRRAGVVTSWLAIETALLLAVVLVAVLAWRTDAGGPALAAMALVELGWAYLYIAFWGLAGSLFDEAQAERLFGPLGAAETAAAIAAGLVVGPLAAVLPTETMLGLAAAGLVACVGLTARLAPAMRPAARLPPEPTRRVARARLGARAWGLLGVMATAVLVHDLAVYLGLGQLDARIGRDEAELAAFLGPIVGAQQGAILLGRAVLARAALRRFGRGTALRVLPLAFLGLAPVVALLAWRCPESEALFWLAVLLGPLFQVLWDAVAEPTYYVMHQPLDDAERLRVQHLGQTLVEPAAHGVAAAALWVLPWLAASLLGRTVGAAALMGLAALAGAACTTWLSRQDARDRGSGIVRGTLAP